MEPNAEGTWQSLDLEECAVWFAQDMGSFSWKIKGEEYTLQFGLGHYKEQDFPGFATAGEAEGIAPVVYWYRNEKPVLHMPCMAERGLAERFGPGNPLLCHRRFFGSAQDPVGF